MDVAVRDFVIHPTRQAEMMKQSEERSEAQRARAEKLGLEPVPPKGHPKLKQLAEAKGAKPAEKKKAKPTE